MNLWRLIKSRLRALLRKESVDAEMEDEMRSHIEMRTLENIKSGMSPEEARRAAWKQFGWAESIKETCRDQRGVSWIENLVRDVRYGFRMLRKSRGFTAVAVLTLALGIGASTAIVSVLKTAVYDPLPTRYPERLVCLGHRNKERSWSPGINPSALRDIRRHTNLFACVVAYSWDGLTLAGEDFPQPVRGIWITPEFFSLWNVGPALGRAFAADEAKPGKDDVLVISHHLWQRRFGGDPAIIGRTIHFRERPMTVIGVMPPHFSFPESEDGQYWRPAEGPEPDTDDYLPNTHVIAALRPRVQPAQVQAFLRVNPGMDPQHLMRVYPSIIELERRQFNPDPAKNKAPDAAFAFFADARERIAALPGVLTVGVGYEGRETKISMKPGSLPIALMKYWIGVEEADPLRVMRVPLKLGRWLNRGDGGNDSISVLVNETASRQLWPGEGAVGKRFVAKERDTEVAYEVVGVVGDTRDYSRHVAPPPTFYRALANEFGIDIAPGFLVVRTAVTPGLLYKAVGQALKAAGADPRMPEFINLHEALQMAMASHRMVMLYLTLFAGLGLLLAAIGLYGVLAYSVARRTREIGIRMALGAQIADVLRLILGQGLALVAVGGVIGTALALATGRALRAYLFGVSNTDPVTFVTVTLLLSAVALLACWMSARRATKVDPMVALRYE